MIITKTFKLFYQISNLINKNIRKTKKAPIKIGAFYFIYANNYLLSILLFY